MIHTIGTHGNGYPLHFIFKKKQTGLIPDTLHPITTGESIITIATHDEVNIGDEIKVALNKHESHVITDIIESRPAKGNYPKDKPLPTFYDLRCDFQEFKG